VSRIVFRSCRSELHAFLYDAVVLDYLSGQDDGCKLRVVGNWYAMTGYGIGFPKQSKFKEMINKEIIEMHHSGASFCVRRRTSRRSCSISFVVVQAKSNVYDVSGSQVRRRSN
jgi:hypothetical protein